VTVSFVTAELSSLKYIDTWWSGHDSRDVKRVSALCDSGAEICVANSSVVEGLNLDPIGEIPLHPFCGNTVTADLVCLNISLADSVVSNVTSNHVVKVTCAAVPKLCDKFILIADLIDRLSHSNTNTSITVSQAQVNGVSDAVDSSTNVNDSNSTHDDVSDDVVVLNSPVANDDVTLVTEQNNVECNDVGGDNGDITDGGNLPTSDCRWSTSSEVAQEQHDDPSLTGYWKLAEKGRAGSAMKDNVLYHRTKILDQNIYLHVVPESCRVHVLRMGHHAFGGHMGF